MVDPSMDPLDRVYFTIASERLNYNYHGWGATVKEWREGSERLNHIFDKMSHALNSNESFEMDDTFQLSFTHLRTPPKGRGHKIKNRPGHQATAMLRQKKDSVIQIKNQDELCCSRALITARAKIEKSKDWEPIRKGRQIQTWLARSLHRKAGVPEGACGYDELEQFQTYLTGYEIVVVDADRRYSCKSFKPQSGLPKLSLLYSDGHYDVITTLQGFFGTKYFCNTCLQGYDNLGKHTCKQNKKFCYACRQQNCSDHQEAQKTKRRAHLRCSACNRKFFGENCLQNHLTMDRRGRENSEHPVCRAVRRCGYCQKQENTEKDIARHQCGYGRCPSCKDYVNIDEHKCFIQVSKKRKAASADRPTKRQRKEENEEENDESMDEEDDDETESIMVFFDIEAMMLPGGHEPNLLVAETDQTEEPIIFRGKNCVAEFLIWLEELTEEDTQNVTVVAHNFQGYDGYFVVEQYYRTNQIIEQLRNGAKLLQVQHDRIRFIDSLNFFAMKLDNFPKTFGIQQLKKGYFPHVFNVPANQNYVGELPSQDYYMPEVMGVRELEEFQKWHQEQRDRGFVFDFQKELVDYCVSDVKLLKAGCLTFKNLFEEIAGFNPFSKITIASAANEDLRRNRLQENTIASEPLYGWKKNVNQSNAALQWLAWENYQLRQQVDPQMFLPPRDFIQHSGNAGEYKIPGTRYHVDGYCRENNTVYEFLGCFYHGCKNCFPVRHENTGGCWIVRLVKCTTVHTCDSKPYKTMATLLKSCGNVNGRK